MARYLLDASFLIDHLRGVAAATERFHTINEGGELAIVCDVSAAEVWSGRLSEHPGIDRLLRYLEFVQPGPEASKLAGIWRAEARARGRSLDIPDALIAASAYHLHAAVLTRNVRDFELTPVRIETY
jgi:predicted nucleic acid-binding protein